MLVVILFIWSCCYALGFLLTRYLHRDRDGSSWNWTSHCCVECWQSDERM